MSTSMILLVALQALWLRNSYEKAFDDFREESSRLLRESVFAVRDSVLLKHIEAIPDSGKLVISEHENATFDVLTRKTPEPNDGQVQVYMSPGTTRDSTRILLRSIATRVSEGRIRGNSRFTIRFGNDSLNTDSIKAHFARALQQSGKTMPFEIRKSTGLPPFPHGNRNTAISRIRIIDGAEGEDRLPALFGNELRTEWVRVDPGSRYGAVLSNVRPMLIKVIAPQILFGGFLTLLTLISFVVMYRSIRSQQRLMALKNDFISNITHELKTPIATVSVALEALKNFKGIDNPKLTTEYLDIAQLELGRLSILTEKVLTTSLFDERGMTLESEPVDLDATVSSILNSMKLVLEKAQAKVSFEKTGEDFTLNGSSLHLTNVVYNLLDNALKYSPSNPEIMVTLRDAGANIELAVADKGLGIAPEFQSKVFERFFRMPTGDVHNIKGYGLGLSYVDQVVKKHGGSITVASAPGQGSTFTVILPKRHT